VRRHVSTHRLRRSSGLACCGIRFHDNKGIDGDLLHFPLAA
jgi:hypothetical protein